MMRTVCYVNVFEDKPHGTAAQFAVSLCERHRAHLSAHLGANKLIIPGSVARSLVIGMAEEVNAERLRDADAERAAIETAARLASVNLDLRVTCQPYHVLARVLADRARVSDLVVLPRRGDVLSASLWIIEEVLFNSGRPVLLVPDGWAGAPSFPRVTIAWDGSAKAARAVGDAMPFLEEAESVEILFANEDGKRGATGAELATSLSRRCRNVSVSETLSDGDSAGEAILAHLRRQPTDLLVMGAYSHPRWMQLALGGVTRLMLEKAPVPVLLSY